MAGMNPDGRVKKRPEMELWTMGKKFLYDEWGHMWYFSGGDDSSSPRNMKMSKGRIWMSFSSQRPGSSRLIWAKLGPLR
ncbi:hypothetical protein L1049_022211 [Liquidambar formosana]|uniref:Uncharacterized protein n=1 Tax=Liquidambar formosana TaxID=63359 RepID=A0AAP0RC44_LIQFO